MFEGVSEQSITYKRLNDVGKLTCGENEHFRKSKEVSVVQLSSEQDTRHCMSSSSCSDKGGNENGDESDCFSSVSMCREVNWAIV